MPGMTGVARQSQLARTIYKLLTSIARGGFLPGSIVTSSTESTQVTWVKCSGRSLLDRADVVDPSCTNGTDKGMACDAAIIVAGEDLLSQSPPYPLIVEPMLHQDMVYAIINQKMSREIVRKINFLAAIIKPAP